MYDTKLVVMKPQQEANIHFTSLIVRKFTDVRQTGGERINEANLLQHSRRTKATKYDSGVSPSLLLTSITKENSSPAVYFTQTGEENASRAVDLSPTI